MAEELKYYRHFYSATPTASTKVLKKGEIGFSDPEAGYFPYFKIGDGTTQFKDLPIAGLLNFSVFEDETGTSRTLALTDLGVTFKMNNATGGDIQLPLNSSVAIPIGFTCGIMWWSGAGAPTVTAVAGVEIEDTDGGSVTLSAKYSRAIIEKVDTNKWLVKGELA